MNTTVTRIQASEGNGPGGRNAGAPGAAAGSNPAGEGIPADFAMRLRKATPEQIKLIEKVLEGNHPAAVMVMKADGFLDRKELTEHLKISIRCLEEWQRRGVLPYIKIGRIILFHWPDVVEHLRRHYRVCRRGSTPHPQPSDSFAAAQSAPSGPAAVAGIPFAGRPLKSPIEAERVKGGRALSATGGDR